MNLDSLIRDVISVVNSPDAAQLYVSTGYTTDKAGKRTPNYAAPITVSAQVQALSFKDLTQVDGLNLNGTRRAIYFSGEVDAIVRVNRMGGDKLVFASGVNAGTWLVAIVLEQWHDWCKVAATLQDGS